MKYKHFEVLAAKRIQEILKLGTNDLLLHFELFVNLKHINAVRFKKAILGTKLIHLVCYLYTMRCLINPIRCKFLHSIFFCLVLQAVSRGCCWHSVSQK